MEEFLENFTDAHPKTATVLSAGLWAGFAALAGIQAREALNEGDRKEALTQSAIALAGGAVVAAIVARGMD